jgi:hypothetical protein
MVVARVKRERGGQPGGLAHGREREKDFPSNSCLLILMVAHGIHSH